MKMFAVIKPKFCKRGIYAQLAKEGYAGKEVPRELQIEVTHRWSAAGHSPALVIVPADDEVRDKIPGGIRLELIARFIVQH